MIIFKKISDVGIDQKYHYGLEKSAYSDRLYNQLTGNGAFFHGFKRESLQKCKDYSYSAMFSDGKGGTIDEKLNDDELELFISARDKYFRYRMWIGFLRVMAFVGIVALVTLSIIYFSRS